MKFLISANLLLAFLLEIAMIVVYCYGGFHIQTNELLRIILGVGIPIIIIIFWSMFLAPRSKYHFPLPWLLISKVIIFSGAGFVLFLIQKLIFAETLGAITLINLILTIILK